MAGGMLLNDGPFEGWSWGFRLALDLLFSGLRGRSCYDSRGGLITNSGWSSIGFLGFGFSLSYLAFSIFYLSYCICFCFLSSYLAFFSSIIFCFLSRCFFQQQKAITTAMIRTGIPTASPTISPIGVPSSIIVVVCSSRLIMSHSF